MKVELEDLSFQYVKPDAYHELARRVVQSKEKRDQYTEEVKGIIHAEMERFELKGEVDGRAKHYYSIYKKMEEQHLNFDEVYDLMAFRVILDSDQEKTCYEALSVVHALWKPVPDVSRIISPCQKQTITVPSIPRSSGLMGNGSKFRSVPGYA